MTCCVFFFNQKTAYEMRIMDWSSDVCSSDLSTQGQKLDYPMIADSDQKVATLYGMIHPDSDPTVTVRAVYVIDPNKKVRLVLTYPPSTGRNFAEIIRAIDSLQLTRSEERRVGKGCVRTCRSRW